MRNTESLDAVRFFPKQPNRPPKKRKLVLCPCLIETYNEDSICSVCRVEARFLGLTEEQVSLYAKSKTTIESRFTSYILSLRKRIEIGEQLFEQAEEVPC